MNAIEKVTLNIKLVNLVSWLFAVLTMGYLFIEVKHELQAVTVRNISDIQVLKDDLREVKEELKTRQSNIYLIPEVSRRVSKLESFHEK